MGPRRRRPARAARRRARTTSWARARASRRSSSRRGCAATSPSTTPSTTRRRSSRRSSTATGSRRSRRATRRSTASRSRQGESRRQVARQSTARRQPPTLPPCGSSSSRRCIPGPDAPDLGTFVAQVERALVERGHEIDRAVLDTRAGGKLRYLELARRTLRAREPDVVYAHFLVPSGLIAALAGRAPLVVTAHGRDVRNIGELPGVAAATRFVVRRASRVVSVSEYLRRELEAKMPEARGKTRSCSSGVDLERFAVAPAPERRRRAFLCVGALTERKNVVRLADAFARLGDGHADLRRRRAAARRARGPRRVELPAASRTTRSGAARRRARRSAQPSLIEPLGQSLLEAMASGRSGRRHADRRPAGVRPARRRRARRPARRRGARARARGGGGVPRAERGGAGGRGRARRPPSGGADRGDPQPSGCAGRRA